MLPVLANNARYQVCMASSVTSSSNANNLGSGVSNMVNAWNQVASQNSSGPTFQLQISSTTGCQITVKLDSAVTSGAQWTFTKDPSGNITGGTVRVNPNDASSFSADLAANVFTHELGHGLGLGDVDTTGGCSQTDTIMLKLTDTSKNFTCTPSTCDKQAENDQYSPPPPPPCPSAPYGCDDWDPFNCVCNSWGSGYCLTNGDCTCNGECQRGICVWAWGCSPIIIAVGQSTDYQLTSAQDGVWFDLEATGVNQRVAWTRAADPVAFLVLDRNSNGIIDNGSELFGNHTYLPNGQLAPNGFYALTAYDLSENGGNGDGVIDARDAIWGQLRLWIDWNHNGFSEANELYRLEDFGLTQISLDYQATNRQDAFGNVFRLAAPCQMAGKVRFGYDVYFTARPPKKPTP